MNNKKKNKRIIVLIAVILVISIIITVIMRSIGNNNQIQENTYLAGENTNSNLIANNIKKGITIGGITGTLEALDTSDATATPEDILEGKTAYVNGVKITGTMKETVKIEGVTIPKGFYYVGGTKSDGIVISDNQADENKYSKDNHADQANIPGDGLAGNQFVWVPVENISEFKRYPSYSSGKTQSISDYTEPAGEGYRYPNEVEEYNAMMQSVEKNQGFYVARYEAGNENGTVVSKKGATVYDNVAWGDSMTSPGGSNRAVTKAKGMYSDKNTYNVTSTLIYGVQWDAIMSWIDPAYETSSCTSDSYVRNSRGKGNYSNKATSGSNDNYRVKNIYDLAGNVTEWTMEAEYNLNRICRGGNTADTGASGPASHRWSRETGLYAGFRVALYL